MKKIDLTLSGNFMLIDNIKIDLINVEGFYINNESPIMTMIEIRDKSSRVYGITSLNFGRIGKDFEIFLVDFENKIRDVNPGIKELNYFDFHSKQYIFTKTVLIVGSVLLLLVDLVFFYLVIYKQYPMTWKVLWINTLFFGLYGFYKRNKKTTANRP